MVHHTQRSLRVRGSSTIDYKTPANGHLSQSAFAAFSIGTQIHYIWGSLVRNDGKRTDFIVYGLILALGGLQLALGCRTAEFLYDPYYYELAQSFLKHTLYGFNFRPEPMVPPGFPAILAILILILGHSFAALIRSMAFFTTFGLLAGYELLKCKAGPRVAGVVSLLLASSPTLFEFSTRMLFSDMPYLLTSMLLLLAVTHLDSAVNRSWLRASGWWVLCALLLVGSILLRSTGIALAAGIFGSSIASQRFHRITDKRRLTTFISLAALGIVVQASWILWAEQHPVSQWPVHGFQESYIAQLRLRNGNNPGLGMATWQDVIKRPIENEDDMATSIAALFSHKQMSAAWYSPATSIPLVLLLIGLFYSFARTGGDITEWYFVGYQCLYLFWPWNFELRFQIPVAPLGALYIWRGATVFWRSARTAPLQVGTLTLTAAALGIATSVICGWNVHHPSALMCIMIWLLIACLSAAVLLIARNPITAASILCRRALSVAGRSPSAVQMVGRFALVCLLTTGICMQIVSGRENVRRAPEMDPDIEAAQWIRAHTDRKAVVMARWEAVVYHYSGHKVLWFPPSTNAQLLMDGVHRYHIRFIVVAENDSSSYWKPSDTQCFRVLLRANPAAFRLVHQGQHGQVYQYVGPPDSERESLQPNGI